MEKEIDSPFYSVLGGVKMLKCNINIQVYVKLTPHGKIKLNEYYKEFNSKPEPDYAGFYKFQLWELMSIFGEHHYLGGATCFENNEIVFVR
jgi:hypothetical protein